MGIQRDPVRIPGEEYLIPRNPIFRGLALIEMAIFYRKDLRAVRLELAAKSKAPRATF